MKLSLFIIIFSILTLMLTGCSSSSTSSQNIETGDVEVVSYLPGQRSRVTSWNKLIAQISADDMTTVVETVTTTETHIDTVISISIPDIPVGLDRVVTVWTENNQGDTINGTKSITKDITQNSTTTFSFAQVSAVKGSIVLQFADVNSDIKKGSALFILADTTYSSDTIAVSSGRVEFAIDNIPHESIGNLSIFALDATNNKLANYTKEIDPFTFNAELDSTIVVQWGGVEALGTASMEIGVASTGVTLLTGIMDENSDALQEDQSGELVICEIQPESEEEFIEIYNPSDTQFSKELTLEIIKSSCRSYSLGVVTIDPYSYFVVGAEDPANTTYVNKQASSLESDIASTGGLIVLKNGDNTTIDRVFFSDESEYGWNYKNDHSLVLSKLTAAENDFGKNWQEATSTYTSSQQELFGTPAGAGR
jgi:hypothetical protein